MGSNIDLELSSESVYATSAILWSFRGNNGIQSATLYVTLSNGDSVSGCDYASYEYETNRVERGLGGSTTPGYYRFSINSCQYNDNTITFPAIWTDWYYLESSSYWTGGSGTMN